jgi:hypothetical protein
MADCLCPWFLFTIYSFLLRVQYQMKRRLEQSMYSIYSHKIEWIFPGHYSTDTVIAVKVKPESHRTCDKYNKTLPISHISQSTSISNTNILWGDFLRRRYISQRIADKFIGWTPGIVILSIGCELVRLGCLWFDVRCLKPADLFLG